MMDGGGYMEQYQEAAVEDQYQQRFDDNVDETAGGNFSNRGRDSNLGKLFVGGIAWETSQERFTNYFCKYGKVTDAIIMMEKFTGKPRGFGFVTFADPAVADKVLEEEHAIDGRAIEVKRTVPRDEIPVRGVQKTRKIFVGGLLPSITEDELNEYFSSFGPVVEHQIMFDHNTGRSRGFGFVTFENEEAVERILADGRPHELGGKPVDIKKAVPKRSGPEYAYEYGGSSVSKPYSGFRGSATASRGGYGRKMGGGGYGDYGSYSGYMGNNYGGGAAAGFYGGYGGYGGYGYGFWGPMYGGSGAYGGGIYGGYGGGAGYGGGGGGSGGGGFGGGRGYVGGGGSSGGGDGKGYGAGAATGRYHPYRK